MTEARKDPTGTHGSDLYWPAGDRRDARLRLGAVSATVPFALNSAVMIWLGMRGLGAFRVAPAQALISAAMLGFVFSTPLHEAAHATTAWALGYRVGYVRLSMTMSLVDWSRETEDVTARDLGLIAAAGPAMNLLLGAGALGCVAWSLLPVFVGIGLALPNALALIQNLAPRAHRDSTVSEPAEMSFASDGLLITTALAHNQHRLGDPSQKVD